MNSLMQSNVVWHSGLISDDERSDRLGQRGVVVWFTGLSGSGKSTIAVAVEAALIRSGRLAYVLDGDNVRHGLCADLGFDAASRTENLRRVGHVARILLDAGMITLAAFVSPLRADRAAIRALQPPSRFVEIYVATPLEICEGRDPKGLYRRARTGELKDFTGISAPYEPPTEPELTLRTEFEDVPTCVSRVLTLLETLTAPG